jgi:hypothetical protein
MGLAWAAAYDVTVPVTASMVSEPGSLTYDNVLRLHEWFEARMPEHRLGWTPSSPGYPSSDRIEWALRGGDAARRWARKIVRAEVREVESTLVAALEAIDYDDEHFYFGIMDSADPDIVRAIVRVGDDPMAWDSLTASGDWSPVPYESLRRYDAVEIENDTLAFVAAAFLDGADGVKLVFATPLMFLEQIPVLADGAPADVSDGEIAYAIVDETDTSAVMDVIKLAPGPKGFRRQQGVWIADDEVVKSLRSIHPPAIVELVGPQLDAVLEQIDLVPSPGAAPASAGDPAQAAYAAQTAPPGSPESGVVPESDEPVAAEDQEPTPDEEAMAAAGGPRDPGGSAGHGASGRYFAESSVKRDATGKFAPKSKARIYAGTLDPTKMTPEQMANYIKYGPDPTPDEGGSSSGGSGSSGGGSGATSSKDKGKGKDEKKSPEQAKAEQAQRAKEMGQLTAKEKQKQAKKVERMSNNYALATLLQEKKMLKLEKLEQSRIAQYEKSMERLREKFARHPNDPALAHEFQMLTMDEAGAKSAYAAAVERESMRWQMKSLRYRIRIQRAVMASAADLRREAAVLETLREAPLIAAGGADRNRGNAETLRRYWTHGKGALKIQWGTSGDWRRCVAQLQKYMGVRARGYCQLRHKEATGVYTGDKRNV